MTLPLLPRRNGRGKEKKTLEMRKECLRYRYVDEKGRRKCCFDEIVRVRSSALSNQAAKGPEGAVRRSRQLFHRRDHSKSTSKQSPRLSLSKYAVEEHPDRDAWAPECDRKGTWRCGMGISVEASLENQERRDLAQSRLTG